MKKGDEIIRVKEQEQFDYLKKWYTYVSKSEWKKYKNSENSKNNKSDIK